MRLRWIIWARWCQDAAQNLDSEHIRHEWDFEAAGERARHLRILELVERHLGPPPWRAAIDAGCSDGVFAGLLLSRCSSVVACDISREACCQAVVRLGANPRLTICQVDLVRSTLPGQYGLVFAMDIFEHIPSPYLLRRAMDHAVAALEPGGLLAFCDCRQPSERRFWSRWLWEGASNLAEVLRSRDDLDLLDIEEHPPAGVTYPNYIDHVLAVYRKR